MRLMFSARAIHNMAGGVERMITTIMNEMVDRGHEVGLLTWDLTGAQSFYPMAEEIQWHCLNQGSPYQKATLGLKIKRASAVRSIIKAFSPDVVVAFQSGMFVSLKGYTLGLGVPIIAAERNAISRFDHVKNGKLKKSRVLTAFRFAQNVTLQCEEYRNEYPSYLANKIEVIPNPVATPKTYASSALPNAEGEYMLLSVGRLSYQKNYECLVRAFAEIESHFSNWKLTIVGEGEERSKLEALIAEKGLENRVALPGATEDVDAYYANANLFCLPSLWEGFPNALAEAMAHGVPSVGFADCSGVNSLIKDCKTGVLASINKDHSSLSKALAKLMGDDELRSDYGKTSCEYARSFQPRIIFDQWENLFKRIE